MEVEELLDRLDYADNLMLTQLEERKSLRRGIRILDPACGSGAFLVQAYRRLIEREFPHVGAKGPTPGQLWELVTSSIFGVDADPDACSVTELSLQLTLLDYVEPPDLEETPGQKKFQLPALRGKNLVHADFFDAASDDLRKLCRQRFDAVVGNPPWKNVTPEKLKKEDKHVWNWIRKNGKAKGDTPVGGNQVAQAFTWKIKEALATDAEVAFLIPGMSLFENRSSAFRQKLFRSYDVHTVINFANLTEVLFAGRSRVPAAAFFFASNHTAENEPERWIRTVAPASSICGSCASVGEARPRAPDSLQICRDRRTIVDSGDCGIDGLRA